MDRQSTPVATGYGINDKSGAGYRITGGKYTRPGSCITVAADDIDFTPRCEIDTCALRDKSQAGILPGGKYDDVRIQCMR